MDDTSPVNHMQSLRPYMKSVRKLIEIYEQKELNKTTNLTKAKSKSYGNLYKEPKKNFTSTYEIYDDTEKDDRIFQELEIIKANGISLQSQISTCTPIDNKQYISYQNSIITLLTQIGAIESNGNAQIMQDKQKCLKLVQDANQSLKVKTDNETKTKDNLVAYSNEIKKYVREPKVEINEEKPVSKVKLLKNLFEKKSDAKVSEEKTDSKPIENSKFAYTPYSHYIKQIRNASSKLEPHNDKENEVINQDDGENREIYKSFKYNSKKGMLEEKHSVHKAIGSPLEEDILSKNNSKTEPENYTESRAIKQHNDENKEIYKSFTYNPKKGMFEEKNPPQEDINYLMDDKSNKNIDDDFSEPYQNAVDNLQENGPIVEIPTPKLRSFLNKEELQSYSTELTGDLTIGMPEPTFRYISKEEKEETKNTTNFEESDFSIQMPTPEFRGNKFINRIEENGARIEIPEASFKRVPVNGATKGVEFEDYDQTDEIGDKYLFHLKESEPYENDKNNNEEKLDEDENAEFEIDFKEIENDYLQHRQEEMPTAYEFIPREENSEIITFEEQDNNQIEDIEGNNNYKEQISTTNECFPSEESSDGNEENYFEDNGMRIEIPLPTFKYTPENEEYFKEATDPVGKSEFDEPLFQQDYNQTEEVEDKYLHSIEEPGSDEEQARYHADTLLGNIPSSEYERTWSSDEDSSIDNERTPSMGFYSFTAEDVEDDSFSDDEEVYKNYQNQRLNGGYHHEVILEENESDSSVENTEYSLVDGERQRTVYTSSEAKLQDGENGVPEQYQGSYTKCENGDSQHIHLRNENNF